MTVLARDLNLVQLKTTATTRATHSAPFLVQRNDRGEAFRSKRRSSPPDGIVQPAGYLRQETEQDRDQWTTDLNVDDARRPAVTKRNYRTTGTTLVCGSSEGQKSMDFTLGISALVK